MHLTDIIIFIIIWNRSILIINENGIYIFAEDKPFSYYTRTYLLPWFYSVGVLHEQTWDRTKKCSSDPDPDEIQSLLFLWIFRGKREFLTWLDKFIDKYSTHMKCLLPDKHWAPYLSKIFEFGLNFREEIDRKKHIRVSVM